MNLKDSVIVITGASAGLGAVLAEQLIEAGATVFGVARSSDKLKALRQDLGDRFVPVSCDVTDENAVHAAFDTIRDQSDGRIDVLVNNAGLGKFGPIETLSRDEWDVQMRTNLDGVFFCTQAVVPTMKAQNEAKGFGGHIINIASVAGLLGNPNISAYNVTKFGVRGFSEALMKELRGDGIKVSCLYPGSIETNFFDVAGVSISSNPMQAEDVAATIVHVLQAPDNYLISEVVMRPLRPKG